MERPIWQSRLELLRNTRKIWKVSPNELFTSLAPSCSVRVSPCWHNCRSWIPARNKRQTRSGNRQDSSRRETWRKRTGDSIPNELENEDHERVQHRQWNTDKLKECSHPHAGTEKTQLSHAISSGVCVILVCESTAKGWMLRTAADPVALASRRSTVYPVAFLTAITLNAKTTRVAIVWRSFSVHMCVLHILLKVRVESIVLYEWRTKLPVHFSRQTRVVPYR